MLLTIPRRPREGRTQTPLFDGERSEIEYVCQLLFGKVCHKFNSICMSLALGKRVRALKYVDILPENTNYFRCESVISDFQVLYWGGVLTTPL